MNGKADKDYTLSALRRHYTNPHELYNALRAHDGIYFDTTSQCWLVTSHAALVTLLHDSRFTTRLGVSSAQHPSISSLQRSVGKQFLFLDGEAHRRAQDVVLKPLARMVKRMPGEIRAFARNILESHQGKEEIDIVKDFASPFSLLVVAHILGVPLDDYEQLLRLEQWSDTLGDITSGYFRGDMQSVTHLENYFRQLIAAKRKAPADDFLSAFIEARDVFPDEDDLVANCMMIFSAGRVTTKKLLGNGIPVLLEQWPQLQAELRTQPGFPKLLAEELFRYVTPTRYLMRQATEDVDLSAQFPGTHHIHRGEKVLLSLEAANYDPACFEHPEQFQPQRRPNRHVAFGQGPHQCPGATLARIEAQIALEVLLSFAQPRSKPGVHPVWNPNPNLGGYASYPLLLQPLS